MTWLEQLAAGSGIVTMLALSVGYLFRGVGTYLEKRGAATALDAQTQTISAEVDLTEAKSHSEAIAEMRDRIRRQDARQDIADARLRECEQRHEECRRDVAEGLKRTEDVVRTAMRQTIEIDMMRRWMRSRGFSPPAIQAVVPNDPLDDKDKGGDE